MSLAQIDSSIRSRDGVRTFVDKELAPLADSFDKDGKLSFGFLESFAKFGGFGSRVGLESGGWALDSNEFGVLCEEVARGSASALSVLTVHSMLCEVLARWGSPSLKEKWLSVLASGKSIGGFALTEPQGGSNAAAIHTRATRTDRGYRLDGVKRWISGALVADAFLVLAKTDAGPTAFLVERERAGLRIDPIEDMMGFRAAMLGVLIFEACEIPEENRLGQEGVGFSFIFSSALDLGRFAIANGCVGLADACLESSVAWVTQDRGGGVLLGHQLVQRMIANMKTELTAAKLMCRNAARLRDQQDPSSLFETAMAKYFASKMCYSVANDTVQIHGAKGLDGGSSIQRYWRDSRVMELIEGSSEILQQLIAQETVR